MTMICLHWKTIFSLPVFEKDDLLNCLISSVCQNQSTCQLSMFCFRTSPTTGENRLDIHSAPLNKMNIILNQLLLVEIKF